MTEISLNHRQQVLAILLQLDEQLRTAPTVEQIAERNGMSRAHFHRCFRAVVGESVSQYCLRLRLERAASYLRNSDVSIQELAAGSGFRTFAGFTRAFTRMFGKPPTVYRADRQGQVWFRTPAVELAAGNLSTEDLQSYAPIPLTVELVEMPTRHLLLTRYHGDVSGIPGVWQKLLHTARRAGWINENTEYLGIHHDDWETPLPNCRYDAAITLENQKYPVQTNPQARDDSDWDDVAVVPFEIPGGCTATTFATGSIDDLDRAWRLLYERWLPISGYQPRLSYVYEIYDPDLMKPGLLGRISSLFTGLKAKLYLPITSAPLTINAVEDRQLSQR